LLLRATQGQPDWNENMVMFEVLRELRAGSGEVLGDATENAVELLYCCTPTTAAGLVAARDFLNVRVWERRSATASPMPNALVSAGAGVRFLPHETPVTPPLTGVVHGEGGIAGYIAEPAEGGGCTLTWVLNSDIKGWVPKKLVDSEIANAMLALVRSLRGEVRRQREAKEAQGIEVVPPS
jgi:hypothetical protein